MAQKPKKKRLHYESEKVKATSHWDLDYMSLKEVEAHFAQLAEQNKTHRKPQTKPFKLSNFSLGLILMVLGAFLLVSVVVVGRYTG